MITHLTLENDRDFVEIFDTNELEAAKSVVTFQALLSLYLQHQKIRNEESEWLPYLRTLNEDFSTPYFCKKSELYHLPEYLLEMIVEQNEIIKKSFQDVMKLVKAELKESYTLDMFKWAFFICNSRSVYINGKMLEPLVDEMRFKDALNDPANMALAPLLDLINHTETAACKCQLTHSERFIEQNVEKIKSGEVLLSYQLYTLDNIKKYDQIFINYGTYNNTKLLLEYGFIIPGNVTDFLEFTIEDVNSYIRSHLELRTLEIPKHKYKFIRDHDLDQQMYIDINDGINHSFQAVLGILLVPKNIYNLTQVAFGDDLKAEDIRHHAIEIVKKKKLDFANLHEGLSKQDDLSGSGKACLEYFLEATRLIDKVLDVFVKS